MFLRRRATVLSAAALLAVMGCQSTDEPTGDAEPDEVTTDESDADEDAAEDDDPTDDEDDGNGGDGAATASWMGEDYTFSRVVCGEIVDSFQIRASGADLPNLQVRFPGDGDDYDYGSPQRVEIFFDGEGGTIGDGEGYRARGENLAGVTSDGTQVSGELELEPDDATRAPEVHPDGGVLTFEMICP